MTSEYTKAKKYPGKDLKGDWEVTAKIDGVRAFKRKDGWVSRAGKPLYNLPVIRCIEGPAEGWEAYAHDRGETSKERFRATIQAVRAKNKPDRALGMEHLYRLDPPDERLNMGTLSDPTVEDVMLRLAVALEDGHEGLVLRQGDRWYKVKPVDTLDMTVRGAIEGEGKHKGRLGAVLTDRGSVGTGFTDAEREELWARHKAGKLVGAIFEVSFMHLTADGMFRHPRFEVERTDKTETDDLKESA